MHQITKIFKIPIENAQNLGIRLGYLIFEFVSDFEIPASNSRLRRVRESGGPPRGSFLQSAQAHAIILGTLAGWCIGKALRMIEYNRNSWWGTAFSYRGTILPQVLGRVSEMTLWSILIVYLYYEEISLGWIDLNDLTGLDTTIHAFLGSVLGFLIVFRMNASNNRFWEGRSHWGMIINNTRSLVRYAAARAPRAKELADLVAGYVLCLKQSQRNNRDIGETKIYLPSDVLRNANQFGNPPTAVAAAISNWIQSRQREGHLSALDVRHMEELLAALVNAQGGCEKIQKTPLPFVYASMIKQLIFVYIATLPIALCQEHGWWTPVFVATVAIGFFGIEEASVETEDPFDLELNSLDLEAFCLTIIRDTAQLAALAESGELPPVNRTEEKNPH
jgi:ion channel-forming bestrophin family protein